MGDLTSHLVSSIDHHVHSMPPAKYIDTITKPKSWGGAIELTIFAEHYNTEIASIDVETGRVDHFTPPALESGISFTSTRCIVIYSGIHYDAASLAPMIDAPAEWHQTLFEIVSTFVICETMTHFIEIYFVIAFFDSIAIKRRFGSYPHSWKEACRYPSG